MDSPTAPCPSRQKLDSRFVTLMTLALPQRAALKAEQYERQSHSDRTA